MKIRIMKEVFGSPAHSIKAGTELYGRIVEIDPLCKMFQCTDGQYIGREIPFKFYVEIPEDKTFAEMRVIELEQENLMHLEDVKELQRKLESAAIYGNKVNRLGIQARNDLIVAEYRIKELELDNGVLLASLEQAMLDYQPVVLPKEVAEAIEHWDGSTRHFLFNIELMSETAKERGNPNLKKVYDFYVANPEKYFSVLVNGYTVEQSVDPIEELASMLNKWVDGDYTDDVSVTEQNKIFAKEILDFVECIKN